MDDGLIEYVAKEIHKISVEDANGHWWGQCQNVRRDQAKAAITAIASYKQSEKDNPQWIMKEVTLAELEEDFSSKQSETLCHGCGKPMTGKCEATGGLHWAMNAK